MLAEDISPSRMDKSKQLVGQVINNLGGDRIGIVAYAGKAFPQLPLTTDYSSAKMFLQNMNTDMLSSQGTAIDEAIRLSSTYFDQDESTERILFIVSDGEDHNDLTYDMADLAAKNNITIYSIGVGTEKGSPIPIKKNVLPVALSPASAVILLAGKPPFKEPESSALNIYDPVSIYVSLSPLVPSTTSVAYSLPTSLMTLFKKSVIYINSSKLPVCPIL